MISELVRVLLAANTPHEVIVEAIKAIESKETKTSAQRTAEWRSRKRDEVTSQRHSVTDLPPCPPLDGLSPHTPLTLNPPLNPPTPSETKVSSGREHEKARKSKPGRGTRLTPDWELEQEWGEWAMDQGMKGEDVVRESEKFKDFWLSKTGPNATKANWEATWRNWIRSHLEGFKK